MAEGFITGARNHVSECHDDANNYIILSRFHINQWRARRCTRRFKAVYITYLKYWRKAQISAASI
ncbi:hypothetical protein CIPAW_06G081600 [Carya illinoinensis]|uniref:Uncharacterized protein n=1 Tax=Carya illinoinensis TaxID=32201 RepID=A0A8T1Q987_CARIL|nr:hypothetical protein CIPAW_06G081600 [Carya illinoinensis]